MEAEAEGEGLYNSTVSVLIIEPHHDSLGYRPIDDGMQELIRNDVWQHHRSSIISNLS